MDRLVVASMNNGKIERFTINDPLPSAKFGDELMTFCAGETISIPVQLTGTPPWSLTYTIDNQTPVTLTGITASPCMITASQTGTYRVTALSDAQFTGNCFTGSTTLIEKPVPTATVLSNSIDYCAGQTAQAQIQFSGQGPWEITYSVNGGNNIVVSGITANPYLLEVTQPGVYALTGVKGPECDGVLIPGNNTLIIHELPTAAIQSSTYTICTGQTATIPVMLTGTAPWTFTYTLNGLNPVSITTSNPNYTLTGSIAGSYALSQVTDAFCNGTGISGNAIVAVNLKPQPSFGYTANNTQVSFINNTLNATYYYWSFGDSKTSTLQNPIHKYKFPGVYAVTLIASNPGCGSAKILRTIVITNNNDPRPGTVKDQLLSDDGLETTALSMEVYPNPSSGRFSLEILNLQQQNFTLEITDVTGRLIYKETMEHSGETVVTEPIDLSSFAEGVYSVQLITDQASITSKLILSK